MDATYQAGLRELNELNFARFDAKLEQRFAQQDAKWEQRLAQLRTEFHVELGAAKAERRMPTALGVIGLYFKG